MRLIIFTCLFFYSGLLMGQKVLQIETFGNPNTEKIQMHSFITYQLQNDDIWYQGYIRNLRIEENIIELDDRYVELPKITAFQYDRKWPKQIGTQVALFGVAWSGYALIGTLTDNNPDTNYKVSDALVTGISAGVGLSLPLVFGKKTVKFGKKRRLRMIDITF